MDTTLIALICMLILSVIHIVQANKKDAEIKRLNEIIRKKNSVFICTATFFYKNSNNHWLERVIAENEMAAKEWFLKIHSDIEKFRVTEVTVINAVAELN